MLSFLLWEKPEELVIDPRKTRSSRTWRTEQGREKIRGFPLPIAPKTSLPTGSCYLIASRNSSVVTHSWEIVSSIKPNRVTYTPVKEPMSLRLHGLRSPPKCLLGNKEHYVKSPSTSWLCLHCSFVSSSFLPASLPAELHLLSWHWHQACQPRF